MKEYKSIKKTIGISTIICLMLVIISTCGCTNKNDIKYETISDTIVSVYDTNRKDTFGVSFVSHSSIRFESQFRDELNSFVGRKVTIKTSFYQDDSVGNIYSIISIDIV